MISRKNGPIALPFAKGMAVAAVGWFERRGNTDRHGFLTNAEMGEARNLSVGKQSREAFFHPTHQEHAPIQLDEEFCVPTLGHAAPASVDT
jgi:hypothetical protein